MTATEAGVTTAITGSRTVSPEAGRTLANGRLEGGISVYQTEWDSPGFVTVPRFNEPELESAVDPTDGGDSRRAVAHGRYSVPVGGSTFLQTALWGMASDYAIYLNIPDHNHGGGGRSTGAVG